MQSVVRKAKIAGNLSDQDVRLLAYACRSELHYAAERLSERTHLASVEGNTAYANMSRAEKINFHERELAMGYWCDLRPCVYM